MARISILTLPDPLGLGLADFVLFNSELSFESCGLEGHNGKDFGVLRMEGDFELADGLIKVKVSWIKAGSFSLNQAVAFMINKDGRTVWVNPICCAKCMELSGQPVEGEDGMMHCGKGHCWDRKNP